MNIIYAQLIGIAGMLTISASVHCRKKKNMMFVQSAAHLLFSFQYAILGAFTASFMDIMAILRNMLYRKYDKSRKKIPIILPIIVLSITSIIGYFTYNGLLSLLPILIAIAYTIGASFKDPKIYKYVFGICAAGWLFYNFQVHAYINIIGNIVEIVSTTIAITNDYKRKKKRAKRKK